MPLRDMKLKLQVDKLGLVCRFSNEHKYPRRRRIHASKKGWDISPDHRQGPSIQLNMKRRIVSAMLGAAVMAFGPVAFACSYTNSSGTKCTWTCPVSGSGEGSTDYWDCGPSDDDPNYPCGNSPTACNQCCDPLG
jgi:hypothetical protein